MLHEPLYFECHITLQPVLEEQRHAVLEEICTYYGFQVAKLFMDSGKRSEKDSFTTGRDKDFHAMYDRMVRCSVELRTKGFVLIKRKIEAILVSEYEDRRQVT